MKKQIRERKIERDFGEHLIGKYRATIRFVEESTPVVRLNQQDSSRLVLTAEQREAKSLVEQAENTLEEHGLKAFVDEKVGKVLEERIIVK